MLQGSTPRALPRPRSHTTAAASSSTAAAAAAAPAPAGQESAQALASTYVPAAVTPAVERLLKVLLELCPSRLLLTCWWPL